MKVQAQIRKVARLISLDERDIAGLLGKIVKAEGRCDPLVPDTEEQPVQWAEELVCLRRGLEGLKLKHDSLIDRVDLASSSSHVPLAPPPVEQQHGIYFGKPVVH